jgi:hypothetical protein
MIGEFAISALVATFVSAQAEPSYTFDQAVSCAVVTAVVATNTTGPERVTYEAANAYWGHGIYLAGTAALLPADQVGQAVQQVMQAQAARYEVDPAGVRSDADQCVAQVQ